MTAAALAVLAAAVAFALADRGGGGMNRAEQRAEAERIIRAQLVDALELDGGGTYTIDGVRCAHQKDDQFECHASASRSFGGNAEVGSSTTNRASVAPPSLTKETC